MRPPAALEIVPSSSAAQIESAYISLLRAHPLECDPERRKEFRTAYEQLTTAEKRLGTDTLRVQPWLEPAMPSAGRHPGKRELDHVLLVGGATRIPLVRNMVAVHNGRHPMTEINPDEALLLEAPVPDAIIAGEPLDAIPADVTPHSLGIEVAERMYGEIVPDRFGRIIDRNSTLPTRKAQVFSALYPEQTAIKIKVYQGEDRIASQNTLLGEFLFEGLVPEHPGEPPRVMVEFDFDLNGILNVSATDRGSSKVRQSTLQSAHARLTPAEAEASARHLADLQQELIAGDESDDPLLERARGLLRRQEHGLDELRKVISELERAQREGRTGDAEELNERLVDLMYDLDAE